MTDTSRTPAAVLGSIFLLSGAHPAAAQPTATPAPAPPAEVKDYKAHILTPPAPDAPRINGARVFGARPGRPFLFTVAATGKRPMTFGAEGLPDGLLLDNVRGRITG